MQQLGKNPVSHQSVTLQQTPVQLGVQPSLIQQSFQSPPPSFNDNNLNNQLLQQQLLLQMVLLLNIIVNWFKLTTYHPLIIVNSSRVALPVQYLVVKISKVLPPRNQHY